MPTSLGRSPVTLSPVYQAVSLADRKLTSVGALSAYPDLQHVDVSGNQLESLADLTPLSQMRRLNAARNRLSVFPDFRLPVAVDDDADDDADVDDYPRLLLDVNVAGNQIRSFNLQQLSWFRYLTRLDVSGNQLQSLSALRALLRLTYLNASQNAIGDVDGIGHLPLVELNVSANRIATLGGAGLAISTLRYVDLCGNVLDSLSGIAGHRHVAVVHARDNRIKALADLTDLMDLDLLRDLDLRGNPIGATPGYKDDVLFALPRLEKLDGDPVTPDSILRTEVLHGVHAHVLEGIEAQDGEGPGDDEAGAFWTHCAGQLVMLPWEAFLSASRSRPATAVSLSGIGAGVFGLAAIASALDENPTIRDVHVDGAISSRRWSWRPAYSMRALLAGAHRLRTLSMCDCDLGRVESHALAEFLASSSCLQSLLVAGNHLADNRTQAVPSGAIVDVEACPGLRALLEAVARSPALTTLDLSRNRIVSREAAVALSTLISEERSPDLALNLSGNELSPMGARALVTAIREAPALASIDLSRCGIGADRITVQFLGQSIALNATRLQSVSLSGSRSLSGDLTTTPFGSGSRLQRIALDDCSLATDGVTAVGAWLSQAPSLTQVDVSGNVDADVSVFVERLATAKTSLVDVNVSGCRMSSPKAYGVLLSRNAAITRSLLATPSGTVTIDLIPSQVTDVDVSGMAGVDRDVLVAIGSRRSVSLAACGLPGEVLAQAMSLPVTRLHLGGRQSGWSEISAHLDVSSALSHVRLLDLSQAVLLNAGTKALAAILSGGNARVQHLCLDRCRLGDDDAVRDLLLALPSAPVETLVLSSCNLGENNIDDLVEAIPAAGALAVVDLAGNLVDAQSLLALAGLLERNPPGLRRLRLPRLACYRLPDQEAQVATLDKAAEQIVDLFEGALRKNSFLSELDASEILPAHHAMPLPLRTRIERAIQDHNSTGSRLSRLTLASIGRAATDEQADLVDNRIAAQLAVNRVRGGDLSPTPWSDLARCRLDSE